MAKSQKTTKHAGGRPKAYKTVKELQTAIIKYFENNKKYTITGLAYQLGFASRQALINYEGYSAQFHYTIKRAKLRIEQGYEENLTENNAAGSIFALKNFDWKDRQDIKHDVSPELQTVLGLINGSTTGKLPQNDNKDSSRAS